MNSMSGQVGFNRLILLCIPLLCAGGCASTTDVVLMKYSPAFEPAKSATQPAPAPQRAVFSAVNGSVKIVRCALGSQREMIVKSFSVDEGTQVGFERSNGVLFALAGDQRVRLEEAEYEWRSERQKEHSMDPGSNPLVILLIPVVGVLQLTSFLFTGSGYCP